MKDLRISLTAARMHARASTWALVLGVGLCLLAAGCSPRSDAPSAAPASSAAVATGASSTASAAVVAGSGATSAAAVNMRRSLAQIKFVQMFEQECLPQVEANAGLTPAQKLDFCQCYAAAMADNNSETQLKRYLAGQDHAQLQSDANQYGQSCLEQARLKP